MENKDTIHLDKLLYIIHYKNCNKRIITLMLQQSYMCVNLIDNVSCILIHRISLKQNRKESIMVSMKEQMHY